MKNTNTRFFIAATLLLIATTAVAQQSPVQSPNPAANYVENYSLEAKDFLDALLKISAEFRFPMGVEWVKSADTLKPVRFSRSRTTMAEIIQAVVSTAAGYDWRMEDGVVQVFNRSLMEDPRNPLNVTVQSLGEAPQTVGFANAVLYEMVSNVVRHPESSGFAISVLGYPGEPKFRFMSENAPVRTVVNQLVTCGVGTEPPPAPGMHRIWIATFPETPLLSRTGYLEVAPMLPSNSGPDTEPFWILRPWGVPPATNHRP